MDLETCIVATYCLIDEALDTVLAGQRLRQRGPQPILADSEVLTIEVVGEVLGYRWHRGDRKQLSRDVERINALIRNGYAPMQFTYDHVTLEEAWVVAQLNEALGL